MKNSPLAVLALTALTVFTGSPGLADNMVSIAIAPMSGAVTLVPRWSIGGSLAGFHLMAQDLSLGGGANQFYSLKSTAIPAGGDVAAFTKYIAASGAATNHVDIGSKLTPNSYSALTSADPDVGYGPINLYFIHHKGTTDYFTALVPSSGTASSVADEKPMSGPGGPSTVTGVSGYFGLTFAAANLGYGLNLFYYLRTDPVTSSTKFGILVPALLASSADEFDLGLGGHKALTFTGTDVGFGLNKMYYLRLDPVTGFTILGTLDPALAGARHTADIANLGSVFSTLDFVPGDVGFGTNHFYVTGPVNPTWQSVSFAAIADRQISAGSFTVKPSASSGLALELTVVQGSTGAALISSPVLGVFTVTPTKPGLITLQATQAGQSTPVVYEDNMLRQSFTASGSAISIAPSDFDADLRSDPLWRNSNTAEIRSWVSSGTSYGFGFESGNWQVTGVGDFDGDGHAEPLWRNTGTGEIRAWLSSGGSLGFGLEGSGWVVIDVGDFDGDGRSEPLWRNTNTGEIRSWLSNTGSRGFGQESGGWVVIDVGDFDGDGKSEPLWHNTGTGEIRTWLSAGGSRGFGFESGGWSVTSVGDFDGDGRSEPLWRNTGTGEIRSWVSSGGSRGFGFESGNW